MGAFTSQLVVWVQYGESVVKIREVPSVADVDDLIKAIKSELAEELKGIGRTQIELHRKEEERGDIKYRYDQLYAFVGSLNFPQSSRENRSGIIRMPCLAMC